MHNFDLNCEHEVVRHHLNGQRLALSLIGHHQRINIQFFAGHIYMHDSSRCTPEHGAAHQLLSHSF